MYNFDSFYRFFKKVGILATEDFVEKHPEFGEMFERVKKLEKSRFFL